MAQEDLFDIQDIRSIPPGQMPQATRAPTLAELFELGSVRTDRPPPGAGSVGLSETGGLPLFGGAETSPYASPEFAQESQLRHLQQMASLFAGAPEGEAYAKQAALAGQQVQAGEERKFQAGAPERQAKAQVGAAQALAPLQEQQAAAAQTRGMQMEQERSRLQAENALRMKAEEPLGEGILGTITKGQWGTMGDAQKKAFLQVAAQQSGIKLLPALMTALGNAANFGLLGATEEERNNNYSRDLAKFMAAISGRSEEEFLEYGGVDQKGRTLYRFKISEILSGLFPQLDQGQTTMRPTYPPESGAPAGFQPPERQPSPNRFDLLGP